MARREKEMVTIHLMDGAKITGRIKSFDKFSVLLEHNREEQLIFKHAISIIVHNGRSTGELRSPAASPESSSASNQSTQSYAPPASDAAMPRT